MKEIRAYIQPFKLNEVTEKLIEIPGFPGMTASSCRGIGTGQLLQPAYSEHFDYFYDSMRLEILSPDDLVAPIVDVLLKEAHTGHSGDGVIFISPVQEGIRIKTGERFPDSR